jgi:hypothetical protein
VALGKMVVFSFAFLGMFSVLFVALPAAFMAHQEIWEPEYFRTDQEVCDFFNANNITVYDNQASGGLTFNSYDLLPWGSGKQLSIWWDNYFGVETPYGNPYCLGISYETQHWLFGYFEYWTSERLHFISQSKNSRGDWIIKDELLDDFSTKLNGTLYDARCNSGVQVNILYTGNGTATLEQSWDAGQLAYMISYEFNATASSVNMFTLLGQILTFQAPALGVPGFLGDLMNAMIAIPIYALSAYIVYKLLTGIAPMLSGGGGD